MALPLPHIKNITRASHRTTDNRVLQAQFGSGYTQIARDGLNSDIDSWVISYSPLEDTKLADLEAFFTTVGAVEWFTWTPIGETVEKKWRIDPGSLKRTMLTTSKFVFTFNMTQQFDLG